MSIIFADVKTNSLEGISLTCTDCKKVFQRKDRLARHIRMVHENIADYECALCGSKYKTKFALKRHIKIQYLNGQKIKCELCSTTFNFQVNLNRHIKKEHPNARLFKCSQCFSQFKAKYDLQRHVDRIHVIGAGKSEVSGKKLACVFCKTQFSKKSLLNFHLVNHHQITLVSETFLFVDIDEFNQWKNDMEKSIVCQFTKKRLDRVKKHTIYTFGCHRSGIYSPKRTKNVRRLKLQGSKKLNGFCPAEMSLRQDNETGSCTLTFLKTHVGHAIDDEKELAHIYLTKEERECISEKIASGVSFKEILNSHLNGRNDKLSLLNYYDLHNIALSYNLKTRQCKLAPKKKFEVVETPEFLLNENFEYIEDFVSQHSSTVIFYKKRNEFDHRFTCLEFSDIVIILMSKKQQTMMKKFCSSVIAIDGYSSTDDYHLFLQTLLIVDDYSEGTACAFSISNRRSDDMVDIFLNCIKQKVGSIQTNCLLTNMGNVYYDSWLQIMSPPRHRLFCSWHVRQQLKRGMQTIFNKEIRCRLEKKLFELLCESDEHEFASKLNTFFDLDDENTGKFFRYFRCSLMENIRLWALCFQRNIDSNVNVYMESFHSIFKYLYGKAKNIRRLTDALKICENYLNEKEKTLYINDIKGRVTNKLRILRNRHDTMVKMFENSLNSVECNDSGGWVVYSTVEIENGSVVELFYVQCIKQNSCPVYTTCKLICDKCNVCAHQYNCSCSDSSIKNNMCWHVHAVCASINSAGSSTSEIITSNPDELSESSPTSLSSDMLIDFPNSNCSFSNDVCFNDNSPSMNIKDSSFNIDTNMIEPVNILLDKHFTYNYRI